MNDEKWDRINISFLEKKTSSQSSWKEQLYDAQCNPISVEQGYPGVTCGTCLSRVRACTDVSVYGCV